MDAEPDDDDQDHPPPPPSAFGMEAEPWGCGIVAGLLFAAVLAPFLFSYAAGDSVCGVNGAGCVYSADPLVPGLVLSGIIALLFALATARLIGVRIRAWREGRRVRPPLWVAFVALAVFGWMAVGWSIAPLMLLARATLG